MNLAQPAGLAIDFRQTPFTVVWEVTRACQLRCVHCRADAQPARHPSELRFDEGCALINQVCDLGSPVFVITGGDPLQREDLYDLVEYAVGKGLAVGVTLSGTPLLSRQAVGRLHSLGIHRMALSLDGPTAAIHDAFRKQNGSFGWTTAALGYARELGLPTQINTTVTRRNLDQLPAIAAQVEQLGAAMWSVFFLVTVGRAQTCDQLSAVECEDVFAFLHDLCRRAPFTLRTTAAPHFRRYMLQQEQLRRRAGEADGELSLPGLLTGPGRAPRGVTDGHGFVFVSHTGDVYPSGFLPLPSGNIRTAPLARIYREDPLFQSLHDHNGLRGKCGRCEYRHVCGGSRARAYAVTGDPLAEDPLCSYQPLARSIRERPMAVTAQLA